MEIHFFLPNILPICYMAILYRIVLIWIQRIRGGWGGLRAHGTRTILFEVHVWRFWNTIRAPWQKGNVSGHQGHIPPLHNIERHRYSLHCRYCKALEKPTKHGSTRCALFHHGATINAQYFVTTNPFPKCRPNTCPNLHIIMRCADWDRWWLWRWGNLLSQRHQSLFGVAFGDPPL
jgi:hypothetical protein